MKEELSKEESWFKIRNESDEWYEKYIDLQNYMRGNVYHYTSAAALESILKNNKLWITKSDYLNDKTEYLYAIKLIRKLYEKNKYRHINENTFKRFNSFFKSFLSRSFIFSTSLNPDSVNLWGNYTENDGYNVCFDLREIFNRMWAGNIYITGNNDTEQGEKNRYYIQRKDQYKSIETWPGKVIYDIEQQENIINEILSFLEHISDIYYSDANRLYGNYEDDINHKSLKRLEWEYNNALSSIISVLIKHIHLFKDPIFMQDEEYRITFNVNKKLDVIKFRQYNGVFFPYIELAFDDDTSFHGLPINSLTIGPKNNLDIAKKGLQLFTESLGYKLAKNYTNNSGKLFITNSNAPLRY